MSHAPSITCLQCYPCNGQIALLGTLQQVINNISGVQEITIAFFFFFKKLNFPFRFDYRNYSPSGMAAGGQNFRSIGLLQISSVNGTSHRSNELFLDFGLGTEIPYRSRIACKTKAAR